MSSVWREISFEYLLYYIYLKVFQNTSAKVNIWGLYFQIFLFEPSRYYYFLNFWNKFRIQNSSILLAKNLPNKNFFPLRFSRGVRFHDWWIRFQVALTFEHVKIQKFTKWLITKSLIQLPNHCIKNVFLSKTTYMLYKLRRRPLVCKTTKVIQMKLHLCLRGKVEIESQGGEL